jgi:hypothetical protein
MLPTAHLSGRVEFVGRERPIHEATRSMRVLASPPGGVIGGYAPSDPSGVVGPDGQFELSGLVGDRCVTLLNVPWGWRVARISYANQEFLEKPFTFEPGPEMSDVRISVESGEQQTPLTCSTLRP